MTELVRTIYGKMLVPRFDTNQTPALRGGRALNHKEISILVDLVQHERPGAVFLDIGANVGAYSFALRPYCSKTLSFEPQRILFNMICGSIAINGWTNAYAYHCAIGARDEMIEIPQFDYSRTMSFGSIEFGESQRERLTQERTYDADKVEYVQVVPLDNFNFPRLDLIKIDAEGFELKILDGAKGTIRTHKPIIMIEHSKVHAPTLRHRLVEEFGYKKVTDTGDDFLCMN